LKQTEQSSQPITTHYNAKFFAGQSDESARSAAHVIPLVKGFVQTTSVLDVGCGVGTWLAEWAGQGVDDIIGVDGDYVDPTALRIPADSFLSRDLERPLDLGRRFDLVSTLEVAEHISPAHSSDFIESLVRHGDVVLFSAAIPGQGGTNHINEQWPSYWADLFAAHHYQPIDAIRSVIWQDSEVSFWYRQNMLIFANAAGVERVSASNSTGALDLVHPELWNATVAKSLIAQIEERILATGVPRQIKRAARRVTHHR
jgi:SAM-dependent methyltransferase